MSSSSSATAECGLLLDAPARHKHSRLRTTAICGRIKVHPDPNLHHKPGRCPHHKLSPYLVSNVLARTVDAAELLGLRTCTVALERRAGRATMLSRRNRYRRASFLQTGPPALYFLRSVQINASERIEEDGARCGRMRMVHIVPRQEAALRVLAVSTLLKADTLDVRK
eukprot:5208222-Pleurochrysis_carterae.AAC.3